jgi:hypothetical protein
MRFWWNVVQLSASVVVLLLLIAAGFWLLATEVLPWLFGGFVDLGSGDFNAASLLALLLTSATLIVILSGLAGFGSEIGRSLARRVTRKPDST